MFEMKIDVLTCQCEGELLRFEVVDWDDSGCPELAISLWRCGSLRPTFWRRLKLAWYEFRGTRVHDDICLIEREKIVELRDLVDNALTKWDAIIDENNKRTAVGDGSSTPS
jgi:hypothetical protein